MADEQSALQSLMAGVSKALTPPGQNGVSEKGGARADALANLDMLLAITNKQVLVGIPADKAQRGDGELNNAARAYILNYGAPEANIPARPFMEPGIENARGDIEAIGEMLVTKAMSKGANSADLDAGLNMMGLVAAAAIKAMINSNIPPPLAERTIQERIARGVTRTNTLVDTGEMRNAVQYVIRSK